MNKNVLKIRHLNALIIACACHATCSCWPNWPNSTKLKQVTDVYFDWTDLLKLELKYDFYFAPLNDCMVCILWFKFIVFSLLFITISEKNLRPNFWSRPTSWKPLFWNKFNKLYVPYYMCTLMFHCLSCLFKFCLYDSAEIRQPCSSLSLSFFCSRGLWSISVARKPHKASY